MTNNEIEKTLELCLIGEWGVCEQCAVHEKMDMVTICRELLENMLAYINRQKEEIIQLRAENGSLRTAYNYVNDHYEELKAEKAVCDRALELAVEDYDTPIGAKYSFMEQAKQELEKEKDNE